MKPLVALLPIVLGGCGTLFGRGPDPVVIDSRPSGAAVYIDGENVGTTPFRGEIARKTAPHRLRLVAEGFQPQEQDMPRHFNGWCVPNILGFVGIVGIAAWGVDAANSNIYVTNSEPIVVELRPLETQ
jgi:hypothetical protein